MWSEFSFITICSNLKITNSFPYEFKHVQTQKYLWFSYLTLTLFEWWIWPQLQEEIYFLIIFPEMSSPILVYPFCIHWWRSSFQKWFWRKWKRRIRNILVEARSYFDKKGSLNSLSYLQALLILEVKSMKNSIVTLRHCGIVTLALWHL